MYLKHYMCTHIHKIRTYYNKNCGLYDSLQQHTQTEDNLQFYRHDVEKPNQQMYWADSSFSRGENSKIQSYAY